MDQPEIECKPLANQLRDETKETGSLTCLLCSMASVISGLVLLTCFYSERVCPTTVIVISEQCDHTDLNMTRLKELAELEVSEMNTSTPVTLVPGQGKEHNNSTPIGGGGGSYVHKHDFNLDC